MDKCVCRSVGVSVSCCVVSVSVLCRVGVGVGVGVGVVFYAVRTTSSMALIKYCTLPLFSPANEIRPDFSK